MNNSTATGKRDRGSLSYTRILYIIYNIYLFHISFNCPCRSRKVIELYWWRTSTSIVPGPPSDRIKQLSVKSNHHLTLLLSGQSVYNKDQYISILRGNCDTQGPCRRLLDSNKGIPY